MAPEYAMQGIFSEKSDVFSFGVLLLEIVTGRQCTSFFLDENGLTLLRYVSIYSFILQNQTYFSTVREISYISFPFLSFPSILQAWKLWNKGETEKLIDPSIKDPSIEMEVLRYVHVGLLCVQEFANERPYVSAVLSMLNSEISELPRPKLPAFTRSFVSFETGSSQQSAYSVNNLTQTIVEAR